MDKENIEQIASAIERIIETRIDREINSNSVWKMHYDSVVETLKQQISYHERLLSEYNDPNFTVNRIEMEGYTRALKYMLEEFEMDKPE